MNNDLISRAALLESLEQHYDLMHRLYVDIHVLGMQSGFKSAIDKVKEFPTVDAAPQWISVQDRLPEDAGGAVDAVLVTDGFLVHMAYFNHGTWYFCESGEMKEEMFYNVTHWMPLPEPPKMDTEN